MQKTKMVSLDTSSTISGYAYFENGILKEHGIIDKNKEKNSLIRVEDMTIALIEKLKKYKPDIVICETPPFMNSPKTLIMLAEIVGVVKGWAISGGFAEFVEIGPTEWRRLVADPDEKIPTKRDPAKIWDIAKVKKIFNIEAIDDNEADAILIGQARINEFAFFGKQIS